MLRRIALTLQFPLKTCVIPRFLPPALILPRRHLSASGIIKLVEHELESGQCDFATKQSLEAACTDLKSHLKDREDLDQFVQDLNNEKDMLELARLDIEELKQNIEHVIDSLTNLLIPCTDYDAENAVLEVVPGAGGQEASMFAEELFYMYLGCATEIGFNYEVTEVLRNTVGKQSKFSSSTGILKGTAIISGVNVFGHLKFESGVHRVQRVPVTGSKSDRLQTSTCSVAFLPQPRELKIVVPESELKYEYMKSSGAGGQSVNTTDSACRLIHLPSGTTVECQEERSQHKNKQKALIKLKNLLYQKEFNTMNEKVAKSRKLQIGTMNRNEKIRTYNFNRHMITDHRLGESRTVQNITAFLTGSYGYDLLEEFRSGLERIDRLDKLEEKIKLIDA